MTLEPFKYVTTAEAADICRMSRNGFEQMAKRCGVGVVDKIGPGMRLWWRRDVERLAAQLGRTPLLGDERRSNRGVYIVMPGVGTVVKIGYANDVRARVRTLQTAQPSPLRVLCVIDREPEYERELHTRFAAERDRGEWFWYRGAVREFVEKKQWEILP